MYKTLLIPLFAGLLSVANAGRINIPRELSLVHYERRIPSTLMERAAVNGVFARQDNTTCTADQTTCTDGTCCAGDCCGDGCCPTGFTCDTSGATPACCAAGQTCNGQIAGCTDPTLVPCDAQDFCCPQGEACSLDAAGNAQCGGTAAPPNSGQQTDTATGAGTATGVAGATTTPRVTTPAAGATTPAAGGVTTPHTTTTHHTSSSSNHTGTSTASITTSTNAAAFNVDGGFGKAGVALAGLVLALMA